MRFCYENTFEKDNYAEDYPEKSAEFFTTLENIKKEHQHEFYLAL